MLLPPFPLATMSINLVHYLRVQLRGWPSLLSKATRESRPTMGGPPAKVAVQHPFRGDVSYPLPMPKAWLFLALAISILFGRCVGERSDRPKTVPPIVRRRSNSTLLGSKNQLNRRRDAGQHFQSPLRPLCMSKKRATAADHATN